MLDKRSIEERLCGMTDEEIVRLLREALEETGIDYCVGHGSIEFDGLPRVMSVKPDAP